MSESTPDLATQPGDELLLELADDYLRRYRTGDQPTVNEYVSKQPELADRIRKLFPAMIAMEQPGSGVTVELAPPTERVGATVGRYKLLERIGEGGFGVVYMAEQQQPIRRKVALKVVKPGMDSRQVLARFEAERQALAIMDHENIARVFDAGATDSGRPYFVMELIKGEPITEFCDRNQFSPRERLELFAQVCHAVQHAHQKGVIHRDIKPTNVLVEIHDTTPVVKVIDFGVAKALGQELTDKTLFTGFAQLLGTPLYMSPEQAGQSSLDIDTRSDIYSLGVLLYELLTGTTPFDKERFKQAAHDEICRIIREEEPPKPSTRLSSLSLGERAGVRVSTSLASISAQRQTEPAKLTKLVRGELDWIVMKALEKDRTRRYETATGLARDIERYLNDEPVEACPPSSAYRIKKFVRRNKAKLVTASVIGAAMLAAVGMFGWSVRDRSARQARVAGLVELIRNEVDELQSQQNWPEALVAARRADAAVTGGDADVQTIRRVGEVVKDVEFIDRLEQIRVLQATPVGRNFDYAGTDRAFSQAFREYGVDVDALAVEASIGRFNARPAIGVAVATGLDYWVGVRRRLEADVDWKRLVAVANGIDPDPLRARIRNAWGQPDAAVADDLRQLAESIDISAQRPATIDRLADTLLRTKQPDAALRFLRDAQSAFPGDFWLTYNLAHALEDQGDYEGAVRFYTAAMSIRPNAVAARNGLGMAFRAQGKLNEAIAVHRGVIDRNPEFYLAYNNLGSDLADQGKLDEAVAAFRKAIELEPKGAATPYSNLGKVLRAQKKLDEAVAASRKAIELDPNDAAAHIQLGALLCDDLRDYDKAIECFHTALILDPQSAVAYSNLGIALRGQRKLDEAIAAQRKAIELDPKYANAEGALGDVLRDQGKLDEAIAAYRGAIDRNPAFYRPHNSLGAALTEQGKLDEAIAEFRKAIELEPKLATAYSNLAIALSRQKKLEEAVAASRKAIEIEPSTAQNYLNLGALLCDELKEYDRAIECFRKAIALDPKSVVAHSNLGLALGGQGKLDEALAAHRKAIELDPKYARAYGDLGYALGRQGKADEAITAFRKAIELDPKDAGAYSNLGFELQKQNKPEEAIAAYRQAIDIDPLHSYSYNQLAWLLVTCSDVGFRDPEQAVALAKKAVSREPKNGSFANTLGVACYRAGDWKAAIAAHEKSMALRRGGDSTDKFFMAMAHWQLGSKDEARRWYENGVSGMDAKAPMSDFLKRLRAEAAELLGANEKKDSEPSSAPKG